MPLIIHTSPLGDLEIAGVGKVPAGEPFEVPDDIAETLLEQHELYALAGKPAGKKPASTTTTDEAADEQPDTDEETSE